MVFVDKRIQEYYNIDNFIWRGFMEKYVGFAQNRNLYSGEIVANDDLYFFLDTDIQEDISDGDAVEFQGEQKVKRASERGC